MTSQLSLYKRRTAPRLLSPLIYLSFSPRVLRRPTDSLAPRNMFLRSSFSGSLQDLPFSISNSPLVRLRPFLLPLFFSELRSVALFCDSALSLMVLARLVPQVTTKNLFLCLSCSGDGASRFLCFALLGRLPEQRSCKSLCSFPMSTLWMIGIQGSMPCPLCGPMSP